jgi:uncharacterized protein YcbX
MKVSKLFIYPIKSMQGIELKSSEVEIKGLKWDRRWVLVDENYIFLTQRTCVPLGNFAVKLSSDGLTVTHHPDGSEIFIPFATYDLRDENVKIWDDTVLTKVYNDEINNWFSEKIQQKVYLCFQPDNSLRPVDPRFMVNEIENTSMSDGYPVLILSTETLEFLNSKAGIAFEVERFRPNILIEGGEAHSEDNLRKFGINNVSFFGVKPCARCVFTTIDPKTLEKGKEPLLILSKYRKVDNKILFGQNVVVHNPGYISVGDTIKIDLV